MRAYRHLRGTLVDFQQAISRSAPVFESAGVSCLATTSAQSSFKQLPAGADRYLMQKVLADWPDHEATLLLKRCAEAAVPNGRVVLIHEIEPGTAVGPSAELLMMVLVGGKARNLAEFRKIADAAGLEVVVTHHEPNRKLIVECGPI